MQATANERCPQPHAASRAPRPLRTAFVDYFRCPADAAPSDSDLEASPDEGYFRFGTAIGYGRIAGARPSARVGADLPEVSTLVTRDAGGRVRLPFNLSEVATNLREERYRQAASHDYLNRLTGTTLARHIYYFLRPCLPVAVRKHLQQMRLAGWEQIAFPQWPVDTTIETLMRQTIGLTLKANRLSRIPFIWFWPDGAPSCAMMTHDVEDTPGREFCGELMALDDSFGIKSSFQIVPEMRNGNMNAFRTEVARRGFEVNLHDLNHDGYLYHTRSQFLHRARQINRYAKDLGCAGFRSGSMYREQRWYSAFEFSYDMSVPTAAHLEPQRGGCCTVMPYFIGDILELPLTTTQDYSLFHILGDYSTALWRQQLRVILENHGLASFIAHPDYLIEKRAREVYVELLRHLEELRAAGRLWIALPAEVNRWWRNRQAMTLTEESGGWRITGPDSHRARVAYAMLQGDRVVYECE